MAKAVTVHVLTKSQVACVSFDVARGLSALLVASGVTALCESFSFASRPAALAQLVQLPAPEPGSPLSVPKRADKIVCSLHCPSVHK